jgi:hypothetical protein
MKRTKVSKKQIEDENPDVMKEFIESTGESDYTSAVKKIKDSNEDDEIRIQANSIFKRAGLAFHINNARAFVFFKESEEKLHQILSPEMENMMKEVEKESIAHEASKNASGETQTVEETPNETKTDQKSSNFKKYSWMFTQFMAKAIVYIAQIGGTAFLSSPQKVVSTFAIILTGYLSYYAIHFVLDVYSSVCASLVTLATKSQEIKNATVDFGGDVAQNVVSMTNSIQHIGESMTSVVNMALLTGLVTVVGGTLVAVLFAKLNNDHNVEDKRHHEVIEDIKTYSVQKKVELLETQTLMMKKQSVALNKHHEKIESIENRKLETGQASIIQLQEQSASNRTSLIRLAQFFSANMRKPTENTQRVVEVIEEPPQNAPFSQMPPHIRDIIDEALGRA